MRATIVLALVLVGCGGAKAKPPVTEPKPPPPAAPRGPELSVAECSGMFDQVVRLLDDGTTDADRLHKILDVNESHRIEFVETCRAKYRRDHEYSCIMKAAKYVDFQACALPQPSGLDPAPDAVPPDKLACDRQGRFDGPVIVTASQYLARNGAGATKLSQLATSKERPYEACGFAPSMFALGALSCDDGSHPLGDPETEAGPVVQHAEQARHGNVGPGGRCGSIIDHYEIACPEQTYAVYVDLYFCLPGAWRDE